MKIPWANELQKIYSKSHRYKRSSSRCGEERHDGVAEKLSKRASWVWTQLGDNTSHKNIYSDRDNLDTPADCKFSDIWT